MDLSFLNPPITFIKRNLTGYTLIILILLISYFIYLRNNYNKVDTFSTSKKNNHLVEPEFPTDDIEWDKPQISSKKSKKIKRQLNNNHDNKTENFTSDIDEDVNYPSDYEQNDDSTLTTTKKRSMVQYQENPSDYKTIKNKKTMNDYDDNNSTVKARDVVKENLQIATNFNSQLKKNKTLQKYNNNLTPQICKKKRENFQDTTIKNKVGITTTLFDNLGLTTEQQIACLKQYNSIINNMLTEIQNLVIMKRNNKYLQIDKKYNGIISKGIDSIINYLNNTIKAIFTVTRTSIKTEFQNSLKTSIENNINDLNNQIIKKTTELASIGQSNINYKENVQNITEMRAKIDLYVEMEKLVLNYGINVSSYSNEVDLNLDKMALLPEYERRFDKLNQFIKSDFNNDENKLAEKYGNAYTEYLKEQQINKLKIDPLEIASNLESGIINTVSNFFSDSTNTKTPSATSTATSTSSSDDIYPNELVEQFGYTNKSIDTAKINPIPSNLSISSRNINDNNMYRDRGNIGNYLIDNKTQKQLIEGFQDTNKSTKSTTLDTKSLSFSGYLDYIMEFITNKSGDAYKFLNNKMGYSTDEKAEFNIEENLIPLGFLLFILSMLFYFIDLTS